ncbi:MAG TPA: dTDP-4-dehydrorhamnose reductase [Rhodocyclaceae bacterium]|jgi:dTDP-4-dehydrorhamnose reductase
MSKAIPRLLILGKNGQLGWELQRAVAPLGEVTAWDRNSADLSRPETLAAQIDALRPGIILNAAAYTAVDKAEAEPELARRINSEAPKALAEVAEKIGARLIHYSTDYVFSGEQATPYRETDPTGPNCVYGSSKLAGEQAVLAAGANHFVFRTCWVYGRHGGNFLKTILRLAKERKELRVVADQVGAPTPAALIADVSAQVIARCLHQGNAIKGGLYHLSAAGHTSWHGFASTIVEQAIAAGIPLALATSNIAAITTAEYPLPANRPANSRLDCSRLENDFQLTLPDWRLPLTNILSDILTP